MTQAKKTILHFIGATAAIFAFASFAGAEDKKEDASSEGLSSFQCRKLSGGDTGLATLKLKLMESCNLQKPFSFAVSGAPVGGSMSYIFCCHSKK